MGFTQVFSGPGSACVVKANKTWVPKPSLMEWPLPYKAQPVPWPSAGDLLFMASCAQHEFRGSAALRPLGLRQFTLRCPSLPPTGAAPLVQCPDEIIANHTTLTNTMLREQPSLPVETRAHGESIYPLAASLQDPDLEVPGYFSLRPSLLLLCVLSHSCAFYLGL